MPEIFPFGGKYLRVLTPKTTDGLTPQLDDDDRALFKETHLPLTSLSYLEKQNDGLPKHLRHRITVMDSETKQIDSEMSEVLSKKKAGPALKKEKAPPVKDTAEVDDLLT